MVEEKASNLCNLNKILRPQFYCGLFFVHATKKKLMKKISLFVFASFLGAMVFAQDAQLGLKAGLNVSNLSNSSGNQMGSKIGFNGGLLAHIHMSPNLAVQPEVMYSGQGAKYTVSDGEHDLNINYVNVPVLLQYMFANGFRLETGPQLGFLASVKDKVGNFETNNFSKQDFKSTDFSWPVGLGYLSPSGLGVDARYNFGISNINNVGTNVLHNNVFQAGLFYMLNASNRPTTRHSKY